VFQISEKETRCCHILFAKCLAFGIFSNRLSEVIFERQRVSWTLMRNTWIPLQTD